MLVMEQIAVKQKWLFSLEADGVELSHPAVGVLSKGISRISLNHTTNYSSDVHLMNDIYTIRFSLGIRLVMRVRESSHGVTFFPVLSNESNVAVAVGDIDLLRLQTGFLPGFSRAFVNGKNMVENTGLVALSGNELSNSVLGLTDESGTQAFAVGAIRPDDAWYDFSLDVDSGAIRNLKIICRLENTVLEPHATRILSPIRLYSGSSLAMLMHCYAEDVAEQMVPLNRFKHPPAGWCSWYHYYGTDDAVDIRSNMQAIKESPLNGRLQVIQIDDGWNLPERDSPRCWGDWMPGGKYPGGIKALVDEIHANGLRAGLWLAPFSVDATSQLYKDHPDWLVQGSGSGVELDPLAAPGGVYGLDLTHPEVQTFVRTTFRRVFNEWGFDYIKIDFLAHGAMEGRRFSQTKTGIEAFRIGMKIIRDEAGEDKFILNCGSPIAASIGLCDGMRIGMDVGGRWFAPMNLKEWRHGNCCIKAAANSTIWRQWMHGAWWHNDPDCIILRNAATRIELNTFQDHPMEDLPACEETFNLSVGETLGWLRLVWLSGGMLIVSEDMAQLSIEQWAALESMWPSNNQPVRWVDDYRYPDIGILRTVDGPLMVGIFNLSDEAIRLSLPVVRLGVSKAWNFMEWLTGETFSGKGETIDFPEIPAHEGRLWMLES
jgi:alpha-galactosidase